MRDSGIYTEATKELRDRVEQVDKCFIACMHTVGRLE